MRYLDEYRNPTEAARLAAAIRARATRTWTLMEVCGGQTHGIVRYGLDTMVGDRVQMIHGPGCPVCVTPIEIIDRAVTVAARPEVTLCSFGDMLRVPGTERDLLAVKSAGGDVRVVYSPLDAVRLARDNPTRQVVFFAVGFETTAPANAMAVKRAYELGLENFSVLVSHVLVPPAMEAVLASPHCRINGFLAAGHVCTVMGLSQYPPIAERYKVPIVVTGFEPLDILQGIHMCVTQLEEGRHEVENQYARSVSREGNRTAQTVLEEVFEKVTRKWRGIGEIADSGWGLRDRYRAFDAEARFNVADVVAEEPRECISGEILQGLRKPHECAAFGTRCTPEKPLGAPMVSTEGACAAYYRYRRDPCPASR